jgi:hypothetical protein
MAPKRKITRGKAKELFGGGLCELPQSDLPTAGDGELSACLAEMQSFSAINGA